jgi:hypothetical protein
LSRLSSSVSLFTASSEEIKKETELYEQEHGRNLHAGLTDWGSNSETSK